MLTAASVLAGLGLFFFALNFLSQNLKLLAGRRLRQRIAHLTATPLSGLFVGTVLIIVTQSTSASVFILVGMVRAGMLALRQAQSVIIGLNAGASLVVFFLTFDVQTVIFLLIGITGIAYAYGDARTTRVVAGAVLGIALLFFGLQIMRTDVAPLATQSWFLDAIRATSGSPIFAFAIGTALSVVVQSSVAAIVVMIAFQQAGLFGLPEAIMFVYGANLGSSILMLLLSAKVTGVPKQVALYQVAFNFIGAAILVPLFYVESLSGIPLVRHLIEAITSDSAQQIAFANMIFNTVPVLALLLTLNPAARILQSASPETKTELGAKPRYLVDTLAAEPAIAVPLIELEQTRLFDLLAAALADLRPESGRRNIADDIEAFDSLARVIDDAVAASPMASPSPRRTMSVSTSFSASSTTPRPRATPSPGSASRSRSFARRPPICPSPTPSSRASTRFSRSSPMSLATAAEKTSASCCR